MTETKCQLCGCEAKLTKHHLCPVARCKNKYKEIKEDPNNHIWICRSCHDSIHALYTETELRDKYSTLETLQQAPEFAKFLAWKRKHPDFVGSSRMSNRKR